MQELKNQEPVQNPVPVPQVPVQQVGVSAGGGTPQAGVPNSVPAARKCCGKKAGLILALVAALALVTVGLGLLSGKFVGEKMVTPVIEEPVGGKTDEPVAAEDKLTLEYGQQSDSSEVAEIQKDLADTSLDGIEQELETIEQELSSE